MNIPAQPQRLLDLRQLELIQLVHEVSLPVRQLSELKVKWSNDDGLSLEQLREMKN